LKLKAIAKTAPNISRAIRIHHKDDHGRWLPTYLLIKTMAANHRHSRDQENHARQYTPFGGSGRAGVATHRPSGGKESTKK
jgi:hypothetical protein